MKSFVSVFAFALFWQGSKVATANDPSTYFGSGDNARYATWLQGPGAFYDKSAFLASTNEEGSGVAVHWTIDDDTIKMAVAAKATGWVGFGIGESGSMLGADIVMFSAVNSTLVDSYVLDKTEMPLPDDCQSWKLVDSTVEDGFIIFEATRLLDTGDTQDRVFIDDGDLVVPSTRVLAAWGETPGPSYHFGNTARSAIRFFGTSSSLDEIESFELAMNKEAEGNFTIRANSYVIPTDRTTYKNFCVSREDLLAMNVPLDEELHTIGVEPFIDPRTKRFVHHFVVTGLSMPWNSSMDCDAYPPFETVYVWTPGDVPFNFPSNVGGPLGSKGFQAYKLEIHYDNADATADMMDSSGIRVFYTSKKREFDMGVFTTGDPMFILSGGVLSPNGGLSEHVFDCPSSCSANYTTGPLTVIRESLHMHMVGVSMSNEQIRNGEVLRDGVIEF